MFRLFDEFAVEITEAILSSGYTNGHIRVIVRIIALLRSSTLPIHSLAEFKTRVTDEAMVFRVRKGPNGFAPEYLSKTTKPAVLRGILATTRVLTYTALDCLKYYLDRSRALRPEHPIDENFIFGRDGPAENQHIRPPSRKFEGRDVRPPSWTEVQRVTRAFWRIQLFYDLRKAAASSLLSWPKEDIEKLNSSGPIDLLHPTEVYVSNPYPYELPHPEFQELNSIIEYTRCKVVSADIWRWLPLGKREGRRDWPIPVRERKDWRLLVHPGPGFEFYVRNCSRWGTVYRHLQITLYDS